MFFLLWYNKYSFYWTEEVCVNKYLRSFLITFIYSLSSHFLVIPRKRVIHMGICTYLSFFSLYSSFDSWLLLITCEVIWSGEVSWYNCSAYRKRKVKRRLIDQTSAVISKMAGYEGTALNSEVRSGKMIFLPILEEGVFRFDCSADDRNGAFPSISFENAKVRDTPLSNVHKVPTYVPSFECVLGQQIVNLEVM